MDGFAHVPLDQPVDAQALTCPHCGTELMHAQTFASVLVMAETGVDRLRRHYAIWHPSRDAVFDLLNGIAQIDTRNE